MTVGFDEREHFTLTAIPFGFHVGVVTRLRDHTQVRRMKPSLRPTNRKQLFWPNATTAGQICSALRIGFESRTRGRREQGVDLAASAFIGSALEALGDCGGTFPCTAIETDQKQATGDWHQAAGDEERSLPVACDLLPGAWCSTLSRQ
jgi:hypothetical protein